MSLPLRPRCASVILDDVLAHLVDPEGCLDSEQTGIDRDESVP